MGRRKPYGSIPPVHGLLPWLIRRKSRIVVVDYYRPATPIGMVPMLQTMCADSGDAGPIMRALAKTPLLQLNNKSIRRSNAAKGFEAVLMRWIVERTIAWLNRCRRSAKTLDTISRNTLALLKLASIRLMPRNIFQCQNNFPGGPETRSRMIACPEKPAIGGARNLKPRVNKTTTGIPYAAPSHPRPADRPWPRRHG
jgi:transposase